MPGVKPARPIVVFALAALIGAAGVAGGFGWQQRQRTRALPAHPLARNIAISQQLQPTAMPFVAERFATVIDMRPDGEDAGQPSSGEMAAAAGAQKLRFAYVPVPHGEIPESAVTALSAELTRSGGDVLLYCRSGRRAARTWSLAEASRADGMGVDAILAAVHASGQDASDLRANLERRVRARPAQAAASEAAG